MCFTQSQDHGALEVNDADDPNAVTRLGRKRKAGGRARGGFDGPLVEPMAAFQEILRLQVEALITKYGVRTAMRKAMCRR